MLSSCETCLADPNQMWHCCYHTRLNAAQSNKNKKKTAYALVGTHMVNIACWPAVIVPFFYHHALHHHFPSKMYVYRWRW